MGILSNLRLAPSEGNSEFGFPLTLNVPEELGEAEWCIESRRVM